ncbi:MAG TPA: acyl-CoA dehydrogenase family protein [Polyangiales bacterium]|nr:acyl-CoA dehydrogenase family protein [Polyangiales bacterium]
MVEIEAFRQQVRDFLEKVAPQSLRGLNDPKYAYWGGRKPELPHPDAQRYCELAAERGLTAVTWPKEYGGGGLTAAHDKVFHQELAKLGFPAPLTGFGLTMIGPTLLQFGSDAQKAEHLPRITKGQIRWCQGYSEPNAGSDLASLACAAVLDGEDYVLNGQKIWTSYGDKSDWMFVLVRTDPAAKKQQGITFILIDMKDPGVEVRPILLISGASPFCETFFTDARAKVKDVVGGLNNGWTVAKALLGHERTMIANVFGASGGARNSSEKKHAMAELAREYVGEIADGSHKLADPVLRDAITQITMDTRCFMATVARNADNIKAGHRPGPESSLFKVYGTELNQRREEVMLKIRGPQALGWEGAGFTKEELDKTREWLRSRGNTIEGGTSEVQLNIIAKRVLELPGD